MAVLTFDVDDAAMLKWVVSGAENADQGHYMIISVADDGHTTLRTNTALPRMLTMQADDVTNSVDVAIPASCIPDATKAVDEGENLVINIDQDKDVVYISARNTTIKLDNMFDECAIVEPVRATTMLATVGAHDVVGALSTAAKLSPRDGNVNIDCDSTQLSVGVVSGRLHSQEVFGSSLTDDDEYHISVSSKKLSPLNAVTKMENVEDLVIKQSQGVVGFSFPVSAEYSRIDTLGMVLPTVVKKTQRYDTPCDEDTREVVAFSKAELKSALEPVSAVAPDGNVTFDPTGGSGVVITIGDSVKTIVLDAEVLDNQIITVALSDVLVALKNISTPQVIVGTIEHQGDDWCFLSPSHDDDEDTGADLVIASPAVVS